MFESDKKLGMTRMITRRDIVHGIGALGASLVLPGALTACSKTPTQKTNDCKSVYPPSLTGMRGNHDGAFDAAHQLAREGRTDWGTVQYPDNGIYDLVVVGGGLSGLSAAHFYRKEKPDARILILDNHDDFGGHAKRNEFDVEGRTLIGYGGSQTMQNPSGYNDAVKSLLEDLGVDFNRFNTAFDQNFYKRHDLKGGLHFNSEKWGVDRIVPLSFRLFEGYIPLADTTLTIEEIIDQIPISEAAKKEFLHLMTIDEDLIPHIPQDEKWDYLSSISYRDFLSKHLGITEEEVFTVLQDLGAGEGSGIEAIPTTRALSDAGLPGWNATGLEDEDEQTDPYIHHFPDGNASIARLLVRSMVPDVAPGTTMDDIVTANFDYSKLDQASSSVRVRLNSTVTNVVHDGDLGSAETVLISYVLNNQAFQVRARGCVMACNNSIIPYLCPELSDAQQEALSYQVKTPILYTTVALRNWRAWKNLGFGSVYAPGSYHIHASLDFPVSMGNYSFSSNPDEPVLVHMERFPHINNEGYTNSEQFRLARYELLSTPFETIERNVRNQLSSMLHDGGFDPAQDILGITVNRWSHGYARWYNSLFEETYDSWNDPRYPHMRARKPFGRVTIANADSDANAMLEGAVGQAHRAVTELL